MIGIGFGRTLRYAARQAQMYMLSIAGCSLGFAVWEWIVMNGELTVVDMIAMVPGMLMWIAMVILLVTGMSSGQSWYALLISYGCRRKNAFLGQLAMNLMIIVQSVILYEILELVIKSSERYFGIQAILAVLLAVEGMSQLVGAAVIKWGKAAYLAMILVIMLVCLVLGFGYGFMAGYGKFDIPDYGLFDKMITFAKQWWMILAGAAVCAVMNILGWFMLRNYEVKV